MTQMENSLFKKARVAGGDKRMELERAGEEEKQTGKTKFLCA